MIIDRQTKKDIPGAANMFGHQPFPVSGCFNGTIGDFKPQKVHINPKEGVRLTQNKPELFDFMENHGYPVPHHAPFQRYIDGNLMDSAGLQEDFHDFSPMTVLKDGRQEKVIDNFSDLFEIRVPNWGSDAVLLQSGMEDGKKVMFTGIPGASGRNLERGAGPITDGILRNTLPTELDSEVYAAAVAAFFALITELGLDYATIIALVNAGGYEIMDVNTDLNKHDAIALGNYGRMKYADMSPRKR